MTMINHKEKARHQRMNVAYSELLNFLDTKNGQKLLDKEGLEDYLKERHKEIDECRIKIMKYKDFFNTLSSFLPNTGPRRLF